MFELPLADPGVPDTRSPGRFLLWCARGQLRTLLTGSVFGVVWMVSQAMIPLALGGGLGAMVRRDKPAIVEWSLVVLALGLLQAAAGILRHRRAVANFLICATRIQQLIARRATLLGGDLARRVASGEVANLGASDVERVGDALDVIARFSGGVASYVVVAAVLLIASPPLGAIVVLGVPVAVLAVAPVLRPFERRQTVERDQRTEASSLASDTVAGLRVLRGLGGERVFANRYEQASNGVARASMRTADLQALLDGAQVLLPGAIVVAVTWVGAHLAVSHTISDGELVAFYASAAFLVLPMQTFVEAASKWTAAVVASRRILGVLTLDRNIETLADAHGLDLPPRGEMVDERTGVRIQPGQLTAIVPATPEEGTALLERLARWNGPGDEDSGPVSWAGRSVDSIPLGWYRDHVVMLERSPFHLKGTLRQALEVGPLDQARQGGAVEAALDSAQASEIVESLPEGPDADLPERWRSLSGGQRQRLSLVQVLVVDPDVLVLDDPTSAVDAHTEAAIARSLAQAREGRTTIICTTSPLVAEQADEVILVCDAVAVVGTHSDLLTTDARYEAVVLRGGAL
ncbi:MAG: ABC transporter transmembrane domain-containing protein [Acidimicrobiales bacterium]